jgi:hypothetical protein
MLDAYTDRDLVCANPYGQPWHPDTVTHRFPKLCKAAGVRAIKLHGTRHTFVSLLGDMGYAMHEISRMARHGSVATTEQIYAHPSDNRLRQLAGSLGSLLCGLDENPTPCPTRRQDEPPPKAPVAVAPEGDRVRPGGLEPSTFRSGISCSVLLMRLTEPLRRARKGTRP